MISTLPRGTARDSTLVRAITTDYPSPFEEGPLPDIVTTLLLAMCDPNNQGAPPRSPLEAAIHRDDIHVVETLLQFRADPQRRAHGQELPLLIAAAKGALDCVKTLLEYRANPCATEYLPTVDYPVQRFSKGRRKTAIEVAAPFPEVVELLRTAIQTTGANDSEMTVMTRPAAC